MDEREAVRVFKALGDEKRLRIFAPAARGTVCLCTLGTLELVPADAVPSHEDSLRGPAGHRPQRREVGLLFPQYGASPGPGTGRTRLISTQCRAGRGRSLPLPVRQVSFLANTLINVNI